MLAKKYYLITYGCQMNKNDSERMAGLLENLGYESSESEEKADLVLVNTCSIRDKAERRVSGKFHALHHYRKKHGREMKLAIMGCMPQHAKKFIRTQLPFIDYLVGVNNMEDLPNLLTEDQQSPSGKTPLAEQLKRLRIKRREKEVARFEKEMTHQVREHSKKAWVSIQFGCNKVCSFCIVPFTRGREISRRKEHIFAELAALEKKGYEEVVLLGQNVNAYGLTIYENYDFADLLEDIAVQFPWLKKISFLTSYPNEVTDRLIAVIARYPNLSNEIHFPLQHGDDEILSAMERKYTVAEYLERVAAIRARIPEVRLGTDLIVGFPGETERHFQNMLQVLWKIQFDFANTAAYSPRPGTKAARLSGQLDAVEKKRRLHLLNETLETIYQAKQRRA